MPKLTKHIPIGGGLNTSTDRRRLTDEVSDVTNMQFDQRGVIRSLGALGTPTGITNTTAALATKGCGLFVFGANHDIVTIYPVTAVTDNATKAEFNCVHSLANGDKMFHYGFPVGAYNGWKTVSSTSPGSPGTYETGDTFVSDDTGTAAHVSLCNNTDEVYIACADADDAEIDIFNKTDDRWYPGIIDLGSTSGMKAVYYFENEALRVADGNFGSGNSRKWFGYIYRSNFTGALATAHLEDLDQWYVHTADIIPPTAGMVMNFFSGTTATGTDADTLTMNAANFDSGWDMTEQYAADNSVMYVAVSEDEDKAAAIDSDSVANSLETESITDWTGDEFRIYPPVGNGFNVSLDSTASGGTWVAETIELASTYLYIGGQESLPFSMYGTYDVTASDSLHVIMLATTGFEDKRIIGGRIYYREEDSGDDWKMLVEISLGRGARQHGSDVWEQWASEGTATGVSANSPSDSYIHTGYYTGVEVVDPPATTYQALTGHEQNELSLDADYSCATILNRRAWIANVKIVNESGDETIYNDKIMYSPVNRFDKFPTSFYLDIGLADGDGFNALQGYADRILAFKTKKMYIINVAHGLDSGWFKEGEYHHKGVNKQSSTCKTDYGIAWVNTQGCHFYDGERIVNLMEDSKGNRILAIDYGHTSDLIIGYDPIPRNIVILLDTDATNGNCLIYNFPTKTWAKGNRFLQDANHLYTNFDIVGTELIIGSYSD